MSPRLFWAAAVLALWATAVFAAPPIGQNVAAPAGNTPIPSAPTSLTGSGHFTSACIAAAQYRAFDVFAATAGAATLQVQRYADAGACVAPVGAAVPVSALALTSGGGCPGVTLCGDVASNDGLPFVAVKITLTDTSGSTNAITALTLTQGAE